MLSDNLEKTRNPLKKAMRRRNAKTVTFTDPTYVEASDYDYSDDEDKPTTGSEPTETARQKQKGLEIETARANEEASASAEEAQRSPASSRGSFDREQAATVAAKGVQEPQLSPKLVDKTEAAPLKSRKGTPRNTDSFLRDDGLETRKITLTPGLLREDTMSNKSTSLESTRTGGGETLEKVMSPTEPTSSPATSTAKKECKKDKEKKEKKPGMLSGLFKSKKKDKKAKDDAAAAATDSDIEKASSEFSREPSQDSAGNNGRSSPYQSLASPSLTVDTKKLSSSLRPQSKGKLIKSSRSKAGKGIASEESLASPTVQPEPERQQPREPQQEEQVEQSEAAELIAELEASEPPVDKALVHESAAPQLQLHLSPLSNILQANAGGDATSTFMHGTESIHIPEVFKDEYHEGDTEGENVTSGSGGSTVEDVEEDTREREVDDPGTPTSSPSLADTPEEPIESGRDAEPVASRGPPLQSPTPVPISTTAATPSDNAPSAAAAAAPAAPPPWSDAALRAWLEDGSEVKDMLTVIHHDTAGATAVGAEHPMMKGLYVEEQRGVDEMMTQLDALLLRWARSRGLVLE